MHKYKFKVGMSCGGCSGAVTRSVSKIEGVGECKIDLESQLVEVATDEGVPYSLVLQKIKLTGKAVTQGWEEVDGAYVERDV